MELTYENVLKWFDVYFEDVNKYQGELDTVPNLKKYFASDLEFMMYTAVSAAAKEPRSRDELLMMFIHPGLYEALIPKYYVVDMKQLIVVVQFEIRFSDKPSGKSWPPIQASAHYHLLLDENEDLKIRKIQYWTGPIPVDMVELWAQRREEALREYAMKFINAKP